MWNVVFLETILNVILYIFKGTFHEENGENHAIIVGICQEHSTSTFMSMMTTEFPNVVKTLANRSYTYMIYVVHNLHMMWDIYNPHSHYKSSAFFHSRQLLVIMDTFHNTIFGTINTPEHSLTFNWTNYLFNENMSLNIEGLQLFQPTTWIHLII